MKTDARVETAKEAAEIIRARDALGLENAVLITAPVPAEFEIASEKIEAILQDSMREAGNRKIRGKELTPFLLAEMSRRSGGETMSANLALLENNARIAAQIAAQLY